MQSAILSTALVLGLFSVPVLAQSDPWIEIEEELDAIAIHAVALPPVVIDQVSYPSGLVLYYQRTNGNTYALQRAHLWDPVSQETVVSTPNPGVNLFCGGHAIDAIGRVIFAGGTHATHGGCGIDSVYIYNPSTNTGSLSWNMAQGRWYPTVTMDAAGQAWFFSGNTSTFVNDPPCTSNRQIEVFDPFDSGDPQVAFTLSGDPPNYPSSHLVSDGRIVTVGPLANTRWFDTLDPGITTGPTTQIDAARAGAPTVLLPIDLRGTVPAERILLISGHVNGSPTPTCEILEYDVGEEEWVWRDAGDPGDVNYARAHANAVILANGDVFLIGGGDEGEQGCPIFVPEVFEFDEQTAEGEWTALEDDTHEHPRMYHSVAVLLMDGSVWTSGQNANSYCAPGCQECEQLEWPHGGDIVEIYRPPYYFDADRPEITDAPASVEPEEVFVVEYTVGSGRAFSHAAMIAYSAVTHSVNMTQRYLILDPGNPGSGEIELFAPPAAYAPPGPYMLVVIDDEGIPSEAKAIYLE